MNNALSARDFILDFLKKELIGPSPGFPAVQLNGQEILRPQDPPRQRYGAGILFPMKAMAEAEDDAEGEDVAADAEAPEDPGPRPAESSTIGEINRNEVPPETEQEVKKANEFLPSAMGVSALVEIPPRLVVRIKAAQYDPQPLPGWERVNKEGKVEVQKGWWRKPFEVLMEFKASDLIGPKTIIKERPVYEAAGEGGLWVHIVSRPFAPKNENIRLLTATLVNRTLSSGSAPKNEDCYYQCALSLHGPSDEPCFLEYPDRPDSDLIDEERSLRLLYRHRHIFGVGHGCAADWEEVGNGYASCVKSETLPTYEIKPVLPTEIAGINLSMLSLASDERNKALDTCMGLASSYSAWITKERKAVAEDETLSSGLRETANKHLDACQNCFERIRAGIQILHDDDDSWKAFQLMNRAMLLQQIHYRVASEHIRQWSAEGDVFELSEKFQFPDHNDFSKKWRPFQLAFVLMNITSMVDPTHSERELVDLIWFPTGGGKTEAYLGLSAFTLFLRRLRDRDNAGTTVLMRYTLRLLTTQQFQRAASMICACETIRREDPGQLGDTPYSIGLWVGGEVTPNKDEAAVAALSKLLQGQGDNKFIVSSCPWCGAEMGPVDFKGRTRTPGYEKVSTPKTVQLRCADPDCEFHDERGLPLHVIDQRIYENPPSLVIGTVDKFAMLPWLPESKSLFGIDSEQEVSPPDLIIQDELHLISGPLGSMVGHYETVIDELSMHAGPDGHRYPAKVVASTATISRAEEQITSLYGRKGFLFPPQGLKAGDSFFAQEQDDTSEQQGKAVGRLYVGVLASALPSHVTAQVRVMSALLQSVKLVPDAPPEAVDPYWTLMGYFNALRELGHAATLIRADIREYLNAVWDRLGLTADMGGDDAKALRRFINRDVELTSRVPSSRIPAILQELFDNYKAETPSDAVDVCFATNMIQVGLDVSRLSLMTIIGQPKTTSEYIQASSRVGRDKDKPGLVITNYNPFKPRDRSHFEHFRAYHESIYSFVEPTSVTPFAIPVRERALHALVVTLARFWGGAELSERPSTPPDQSLKDRIIRVVQKRVELVSEDELSGTLRLLDELFDQWENLAPPIYGSFKAADEQMPLMYPAGSQCHSSWHVEPWPTPSSMRNVDADCDARQIGAYPRPE